ncbi:hypothetical protein [Photobacterium leiognathi]|uniref:hypothetical protein n=1 Tax=Photobacterium leiognathi TaxID=553611 RepID=UPI00273887CE|nr:hypothetical protein [Photobacterium leiognathi]
MQIKNFIRLAIFFIVLLYQLPARAVSVELGISGDRLKWFSANKLGSNIAPSQWELAMMLPVSEKIILGGVLNNDVQNLELKSHEGTTVIVPIQLAGVEYKLSSYNGQELITGGTAQAQLSGGTNASVSGKGISNTVVNLLRTETPFTMYRPLIKKINSTEWINIFRDSGAVSGRYQGRLPVSALYDYYRGGVRIRNHINMFIDFAVTYKRQILSDIVVTPLDTLETKYHYPSLVSGQTTYKITAKGYFTDGVWIGLAPLTGASHYSLKSNKLENNDEIKYSVICDTGCEGNNQFIINGHPQIDNASNRAILSASDTDVATADIRVFFERVPMVASDTYYGSFVLLFEARI